MFRGALLCVLLIVSASISWAQASNPLAEAASAIGSRGLNPGESAERGATAFKPSADRTGVDAFLKEFGTTDDERDALRQMIEGITESYESGAKANGIDHDAAGALAFVVALAHSLSTGMELPDDQFMPFVAQLRAALDTPAVRSATDVQKQAFYQRCMGMAALIVTLLQGAGDDQAALAKVRQGVDGVLQNLIGVKGEQITFGPDGATIKPIEGSTSAGGTSMPSGAMAVSFTPPAGTEKSGEWYIRTKVEGTDVHQGLIRFLPSMPAGQNIGATLFDLWKKYTPKGLTDKAGGMVYRRFMGNGLFAQFIAGRGREEGRDADTLMSLYILDLGTVWQPFVVAQTYDVTDSFRSGMDFMARFSYDDSAPLIEEMLANVKGPETPAVDIVDPSLLVGELKTGSGMSQSWVSAVTGASLPDTFLSYSITYNLKADGTFTYKFVSASGSVGAMRVANDSDQGTWRVERDRLILQGDKDRRVFIIAAVTDFPDGVRAIVMQEEARAKPVNATTVGGMDFFSIKR